MTHVLRDQEKSVYSIHFGGGKVVVIHNRLSQVMQ